MFLRMIQDFLTVSFVFLPASYVQGGLIFTNFLMFLTVLITLICMMNWIHLSGKLGYSLREMAYNHWGIRGQFMVDLFSFLSLYGNLFAYIACIGFTIFKIANFLGWSITSEVIAIIQFIIIFPVVTFKKGSEVPYYIWHFKNLLLIAGIAVILFNDGRLLDLQGAAGDINPFKYTSLTGASSTLAYAFTASPFALELYSKDFDVRETTHFKRNLFWVSMATLFIYLVYGNLTYFTFGNDTPSIIFAKLDESILPILVIHVSYLVAAWPGIIETFEPIDELFKVMLHITNDLKILYSEKPLRFQVETSGFHGSGESPRRKRSLIEETKDTEIVITRLGDEKDKGQSSKRTFEDLLDKFDLPNMPSVGLKKQTLFSPVPALKPEQPKEEVTPVKEKEVPNTEKEDHEKNHSGDMEDKLAINVIRFICIGSALYLGTSSDQFTMKIFWILETLFKTPVSFILPAYLYIQYGNPSKFQRFLNWAIIYILSLIHI
eukprot:TRINITY_DN5052_c0_g1_i3.p1 TRINITY_DN5052_c0_g1~~TRINITY_DN5052_c0_g1_i3.p1  ORF type:complete len:491 (+),score=127.84 TRINITY_DN5052_c0_g1_i3:304-1776(+)